MLAFTSLVFRTMMLPHDGKFITIDQLTYYEKETSTTLDGVLPLVSSSQEVVTTYTELSPGQFKPTTLLGTFPRDPLVKQELVPNTGALMCMMTSSKTTPNPKLVMDTTLPVVDKVITLPPTIMQTPFLCSPPEFVSHQAMETLTLPIMALTIPIWYLVPMTMSAETRHISLGNTLEPPP